MKETVTSFINALYGGAKESFVGVTTFPGPVTKWFDAKDIDKIVSYGLNMGKKHDTYLCVAPRKNELSGTKRGKAEDVKYLPCIMLDIDYLSPQHASVTLPPKDKALETLLNNAPEPSFIFSTGNGYHAYWCFETPYLIETEEERALAASTLSGFVSHMQDVFSTYGWTLDSVGDLPRMMRFPFTNNFKSNPPIMDSIVSESDKRYSLEDFLIYRDEKKTDERITSAVEKSSKGSAWRIVESCAAIRELKEHPDSVSEPLWMAAASNLSLCPDGNEVFHELSSLYTNYSYKEAEEKFERLKKENKPCKCSFISKCTTLCPEGGCSVKAPVVFALLKPSEILKQKMDDEKFNTETAYDEEVLKAAGKVLEEEPRLYAIFKSFLKDKKISTRDWEMTVKKMKEKSQMKRSSAREDFGSAQTKLHIPELLSKSFKVPFGYSISKDKGVERIKLNDFLMEERVTLSFRAVLINKIIQNVDTSDLSLELALYMNGTWLSIIVPKAVIASKNSIITLANQGLPVSSENADEMVKYFSRFEEENNDILPLVRATDRAGWINDEEFYPYALKKSIYIGLEDSDKALKALKEEGSEELWLNLMKRLRTLPYARIQIATAYASPLIKPLKTRIPILHVWHDSRSGKSASAKAAASVFGSPESLVMNFNTTQVGLERTAAMLCNVVLIVDELQQLNKSTDIAQVVYQLGNGQGRTRGARNGGKQKTSSWCLAVLSNGEEPIIKDHMMDGVSSRVIQVYARAFEDKDFASEVHRVCSENYGFGARKYLSYVIKNKSSIRSDFEELRSAIRSEFEKHSKSDIGTHLDSITALCLGDYYSSISVFNEEREDAFREAVELAVTVLENVYSNVVEDNVDRAWEFLNGWVAENRLKFSVDSDPCYGKIEPNRVFIIGSVLKDVLAKNGFVYTKCVRGFRDRRLIDTDDSSDGTTRILVPKSIRGVTVRCLEAHISLSVMGESEEDFLC